MSEQSDQGNGRATVALVYRTVDDLAKTLDAEFRAVNARLDTFVSLPSQVASQHEMIVMLQARMFNAEQRLSEQDLREEKRAEAEEQWRREKRPLLILTAVATIVSIAALAASFIH